MATPVQQDALSLSLPDTRVVYVQAGEGDVLLLIHGSLCDYRYWRWQMPALSPHMRVVAPSLRGFWPTAYASEHPDFGIERHTRDMLAFARALTAGTGRLHVAGHSRGAQVALEMALHAPDIVHSLTLADPGFGFAGEPPVPSFHTDAVALLRQGRTEEALALFVDTVNGPDTWRRMTNWFKVMVRDNAYTLLSQLRDLNRAIDPDTLRALRCPSLLIGGENSPARYRGRLDTLQSLIPDCRRTTIAQAAHGMNLANPKAFNRAMIDFISAHPVSATHSAVGRAAI
jgi:pimeloyl-ACP methyl ester carboxylesterase